MDSKKGLTEKGYRISVVRIAHPTELVRTTHPYVFIITLRWIRIFQNIPAENSKIICRL